MAYPDQTKGGYLLTADRTKIDADAVHAFLTRCFWARGISRTLVEKSIAHSLCIGLFAGKAQVGFARVVTDYSTYAYLCDVYVLEEHRGRGLGVWMVDYVMRHPELQGLRRFQLVTRDAHGLYARFGFKPPPNPERQMEIFYPGLYAGETGPEGF